MFRALIPALLLAFPAAAGSITGTIRDQASSAGLSGMTVRLWSCSVVNAQGCKTWSIAAATTSNGSGVYTFSGLSGNKLVDALPGPGITIEYTDRWYAAGESGSSTAGFVNADVLDGNVTNSNKDIYMLIGGGIDGLVVQPDGATLISDVFLRAEVTSNPAIHHNDVSQGGLKNPEHLGQYSFRNLVAPNTYQILSYWQPGTYETQLNGGIGVSSGSDATGPTIQLVALNPATDPWNGSHTVTLTGAAHAKKFTSTGAMIAPLNGGDFDEWCIVAAAGDRFQLKASADVIVGSSRKNPFVDPILRFTGPGITGTGLFDDDSGGAFDSLIADTGELNGGTYCARVSTFGDSTSFNGTAQGSTGRVAFNALLLNRRPLLSATLVPPPAPGFVEGGTVTVNLGYSDADADAMTPALVSLLDANNNPDNTGLLTASASTAVFTWVIPQGASGQDPYVATFQVTDAFGDAFSTSRTASVNIVINPIAVPQQVAPEDGVRVTTDTPAIEVQDLVDNAQSNVSYEFELYDHTGALMAQSGSPVPMGANGHTIFTPAPLPENERITWRVRALHGLTNPAHSAWTGFRTFMVDVVNEPPPDPVLVKPADGDEVLVRIPGFSATSEADPDTDPVALVFEIALDSGFTSFAEQGDPVNVTLANTTTPWTPAHQLAWGGSYYARAYAIDNRGGHSGYSNTVHFTVRADGVPSTPPLPNGITASQCHGVTLHQGPPPTIELGNVEDPDGESVTLELQVFDFAADPATATPLLDVTQAQSTLASTTMMDISTMHWTEDAHYRVRARAGDGTAWSAWTECDFTLDEVTPVTDGGTPPPPDGGTGADGGITPPPDGTHRKGCTSTGAAGPALLLMAFLAVRRLRSERGV